MDHHDGSSPQAPTKKAGALARIVGSGVAGGLELLIFHPVDTVAKRLMCSDLGAPSTSPTTTKAQGSRVGRIVFGETYASQAWTQRYAGLFPGLGFAAGYKVLQRVGKFGGQPVVFDALEARFGRGPTVTLSEQRTRRMWLEAGAGSLVGACEVLLLPLDVLKIKSQTSGPGAQWAGAQAAAAACLRRGGGIKLLRELYRGAGWTVLRNVPGSFALFGGNQMAKSYLFGLGEEGRDGVRKTGTFAQLAVTSCVGSGLSIVVAAPVDVVKTRVQKQAFGVAASGFRIAANLLRDEGVRGFFKGLTPKLVIVGPKLVFSFTVAQWLIAKIEKL